MYYADILVSDAFLIRETGPWSIPFGLEPDIDDTAVWLVDPQCTTLVEKFSGTLVHPTCHDKLGITLSAFAHYAYEASHEELVLADIQGMTFPLTQHCRLTFQSHRLSYDCPRSWCIVSFWYVRMTCLTKVHTLHLSNLTRLLLRLASFVHFAQRPGLLLLAKRPPHPSPSSLWQRWTFMRKNAEKWG